MFNKKIAETMVGRRLGFLGPGIEGNDNYGRATNAATRFLGALLATSLFCMACLDANCQQAYSVRPNHPRLLIADVGEIARRSQGPLVEDYQVVKQRADEAVRRGDIEYLSNPWSVPEDLMNCGLAYLIERKLGHDCRKYADVIIKQWGDGSLIANRKNSHFGYHALAYDWIYDALTPEQRVRYGDALGSWLNYFTDKSEILLKWGGWEYNQTWGPIHLNVMNCRDGLTQKLLISLAILGAGTQHETDARAFLDSWNKRVPSECVPAFNRMGGVWSESYGHGGYGPVTVIPYAFHAWRTATGIDLFKQLKPWGYPVEEPRWVAYTMMPHDERTAWIDDGDGAKPSAFARAAPMLHDGLSQWFSDREAKNGCGNAGSAWRVTIPRFPRPRRIRYRWGICFRARATFTCAVPGRTRMQPGLSSGAGRNSPPMPAMMRGIF